MSIKSRAEKAAGEIGIFTEEEQKTLFLIATLDHIIFMGEWLLKVIERDVESSSLATKMQHETLAKEIAQEKVELERALFFASPKVLHARELLVQEISKSISSINA